MLKNTQVHLLTCNMRRLVNLQWGLNFENTTSNIIIIIIILTSMQWQSTVVELTLTWILQAAMTKVLVCRKLLTSFARFDSLALSTEIQKAEFSFAKQHENLSQKQTGKRSPGHLTPCWRRRTRWSSRESRKVLVIKALRKSDLILTTQLSKYHLRERADVDEDDSDGFAVLCLGLAPLLEELVEERRFSRLQQSEVAEARALATEERNKAWDVYLYQRFGHPTRSKGHTPIEEKRALRQELKASKSLSWEDRWSLAEDERDRIKDGIIWSWWHERFSLNTNNLQYH